MPEVRYPLSVMSGDILRAALGATLCGGILMGGSPVPWLAALLAVACAMFVVFGVRAVARARQRFGFDAAHLLVLHRAQSLPWNQLRKLKLAYFSTRRDHRQGWLELQLRFGDASVRVDSRALHFQELLVRALGAARSAGSGSGNRP